MEKGFVRVKSLGDLSLNSAALLKFLKQTEKLDLHALALIRSGKAFALAKKPYRVDSPHTLFSLSKSFCSMAAGMAVTEGLLSYEDLLCDVLQDCLPPEPSPLLKKVRLRHLLSMSSGLEESSNTLPRQKMDWARAALGHEVIHPPGKVFHYNTLGTYLAGRMVSRRTGMSLRDYLMPRLFEPLGIPKPQWDCCPLGYNIGGTGLHLSVMDLAKVAQLMLNRGVFEGRRLLPEDFFLQATVKQVDSLDLKEKHPHPDWSLGYGFQFWMSPKGRYRGDGMFGQVMMLDPERDLAFCCTAGTNLMGDEMDAIHSLLDGLVLDAPINTKAEEALKSFGDSWESPMPEDGGDPLFGEGTYQRRDGKTIRLETPNPDHLRLLIQGPEMAAIRLDFGRKANHHGEFGPWAPGERQQAYLGRFGVVSGEIRAKLVMPQAPYRLEMVIKQREGGLLLRMKGIGFDTGRFSLTRTDLS